MKPTHERVRELLHYDPETGVFTWLVRTSNRVQVGDVAGGLDGRYWQIRVDGQLYRAHIWAWFYVTGEWPTHEIDHINGVKSDNRFANLRDEPHDVNMRNVVAPQKNNTSGFRGVRWNKGRWQAEIHIHGKGRHLGRFTTPEEAHAAYMAAKAELHGTSTYEVRLDKEMV